MAKRLTPKDFDKITHNLKSKHCKYPDIIFIFGEGVPKNGQALIIPRGNMMPKNLHPVLYRTKVRITNFVFDLDDPNCDGIWAELERSSGRNTDTIISDFEIPDRKLECKIVDGAPELITSTVRHFNNLLVARELLDVDFMKISTAYDGTKKIEPDHYYYYGEEITPGDGKPFRRIDIRRAEVPLEEYLSKQNTDEFDDWYNILLEGAKQYCDELSPEELVKQIREDLKTAKNTRISASTPEGTWY